MEATINANQEIEFEFENEDFELNGNKLLLNIVTKPSRQTGVYEDYLGEVSAEIYDINIHSITGVLNDILVPLENSFDIGYDEIEELAENTPQLHFILSNSFPVKGIFDVNMFGVPASGEQLELSHPDILLSAGGQTEGRDTTSLDENNSNLAEIFDISPKTFSYTGALKIEPASSSEVTITETDSITMEYVLDFPAKFLFSTSLESNSLTVFESEAINKLTAATLALEVENGFPLQSKLVMCLLDTADTVLDSIVFPAINAAPVDDNGFVSSIEYQNINRELSSPELEKFKATRKFILKVVMDTDNKKVVVKKDYRLKLKVAIKAKNH